MGAGAIGMLMGYRLEQAGHKVTLVGRTAAAQAAAENGVIVYDHTGEHRLKATVVLAVDQIAHRPDIIILTVKAFDTGPATSQIAPLANADIPILLIQNGVGGEAAGLEALPSGRWFGAVTTLVAERLGPAQVRQSKREASLVIAPLANVDSIGEMVDLFQNAGFDEVRSCRSYDAMKWSKLLLNVLGNAVPAIVDMSPGQTITDCHLFTIERAAYLEALAVMRASSIHPMPLPGYPVPLLAWAMRRLPAATLRTLLSRLIVGGRGGKKPSLCMDLAGRRAKSEVQFLNGAVVRQGEKVGIATPVNRSLTDTLLSIAGGEEPWERYQGNPQALMARCGLE